MPIKPNLFIIGAPKSGTTSLAYELSSHPSVFCGVKEPRYFDAPTFYDFESDFPIKSLDEYLKLYESSKSRHAEYSIDASVFNMYSRESLQKILDLSPNAKFIVCLRDPLDATKSMHRQRLKYTEPHMRELSEDLESSWRALELRRSGEGYPYGCRNRFIFRYDLLFRYELYILALDEMIPPENIIFINFEVYRSDPIKVHQEIIRWLGLQPHNLSHLRLNEGYTVSSNVITRSLHRCVRYTSPIRKFLHLDRGKLRFLVKFYRAVMRTYDFRPQTCEIDDEIRIFFSNTYDVMDEVFRRNKVNS